MVETEAGALFLAILWVFNMIPNKAAILNVPLRLHDEGRMPMPRRSRLVWAVMMMLLTADVTAQQPPAVPPAPGAIPKVDRQRALDILDVVSRNIHDTYYDPKMNGLDWNEIIQRARDKIVASNSLNDAFIQIAIAVSMLNDSHTRFQPPRRPYHLDFGFEYQMFWNHCLITRVRPGSDGAAKGLKPGDEILAINGTPTSRHSLRNIEYLNYVLDPRAEMQLQLKDSSGAKRGLELAAKLTNSPNPRYRTGGGAVYEMIRNNENLRHRMRMQLVQVGDVGILKFPWFFYDVGELYSMSGKIRKNPALIVDLRGNPGGDVETAKYFTAMFLDHDVKLFDRVGRKKTAPETLKSTLSTYYPGKLVVLVDSESASAAEIFARVMQVEKRGTVIGDRTSGSVMEATSIGFTSSGVDYGAEITVANLVMADGQSLEHRGVNPDEVVLPQPTDLASGGDPVLAHAAAELGVTISPEDVGKLFPYEWPKD